MRIGVESSVVRVNRAGSAIYTRNLAAHLQSFCTDHRFFFYGFGIGGEQKLRRGLENVVRHTLWMHLALPVRVLRDRIDLFHGTVGAPMILPCPFVLTILDLIHVKYPEWFDRSWFYFYLKQILPILVRRADRIVTISECSKRDLMEQYDLPAEKVKVISPAVDHRLFHARYDPQSVGAVKERFGIAGKYILSVGTLEPRKNFSLLVESFALLRKWKIDDYRLVIAGEKGWKYDQIFRTVRDLGLEDEVRFLGYVPTEDLPLLYRGAELFVYPSLYEGFGVPILEAMACGCPVVASDRASIPEVCGAAGILVAPEDRDDVAEAMGRVLSDPSLADAMRVRGRERAEGFRWETSARALLLLYEECARS